MKNKNPNQQVKLSPRMTAQAKYNTARMNLLLVVVFTVINIILAAAQTDVYFLFSATVPIVLTDLGTMLYAETASIVSLIIFAVIGVVLTVPYLVCWKFSQKHYGWMVGVLVYFILDSLLLLFFFDVSLIIDLLFHAWVLYYLIIGVKYGKQLQTLPEEEPVLNADFTINTEENTENTDSNENTENNENNDHNNTI